MARQNSLITFTGTLGNLIGYERNGKFFLRGKPDIVRQTVATRRAAQRFGMASRKGAIVRHAFYDNLDIHCDSSHINRLNKVLIAAAGNKAAMVGFRFNQYAGIDRFFTVAPKLSRDGILHIPPQVLAYCKDISSLEVKVIVAHIDFITRQVISTNVVVMAMDTREYFAGADIELNVSGTGTLVVTLQVRAVHKDGRSCNRQYMAADIVAVMALQTPKVLCKHSYPQCAKTGTPALFKLPYMQVDQDVMQRE